MNRTSKTVDDQKLWGLWQSRMSDKEIAALLGHNRGVVRRRAKALGFPTRRLVWAGKKAMPTMPPARTLWSVKSPRPRMTSRNTMAVLDLLNLGLRQRDIAKSLRVSRGCVAGIAYRSRIGRAS